MSQHLDNSVSIIHYTFPGTFAMEPKCGRPKGMKINPVDGLLYVADSYKGLMKMNISNGNKETILTG